MRSGDWTIVTREPNRAKICANSRPTGPAPTTSSDSGSSVSSSAETWSTQSISSMPSIGGTAVREPVATRMRSAVSSCSPTLTVCASTSAASPSCVSKPGRAQILDPFRLRLLQRVLPLLDPGQVDRRRPDLDAELPGELVDVVHELRDDEVGLCRLAGDVRAASSPAGALDERNLRAVLRRGLGRAVPRRGSRAQDDQVVVLHQRASSAGCALCTRSHALAARYTEQSLNRMEIFDISVPIRTGMVTYPGDPQVRLERVASIADGAPANVSKLDLGVHSGTHVDAPVHFIEGAAGAEELPAGRAPRPVRRRRGRAGSPATMWRARPRARSASCSRRRTPSSGRRTSSRRSSRTSTARRRSSWSIAASSSSASTGSRSETRTAHHILLGAGVVPIEGLDLRGIEPGDYFLVAAPLKIEGSDGAPARVLLVRGLT